MDTCNRLTAVRGEGGWGPVWKKAKGLSKKHTYKHIDTDNSVVITKGKGR